EKQYHGLLRSTGYLCFLPRTGSRNTTGENQVVRVELEPVRSDFFKLQFFKWFSASPSCRVTNGYNTQHFVIFGNAQKLLNVFFCRNGFGMLPVANLNPAASQSQALCSELKQNGCNGAIFNPNVVFGFVSTYNYSQRSSI